MDTREVIRIAGDLLAELPDQIRAGLRGVEIRVVDHEGELAGFVPVERGMRGVFHGRPLSPRDVPEDLDDEDPDDADPPRGWIFLVAANLADTDDACTTLLHEIGHALGLDEIEVAELGLSDFGRIET